RPSMARTGLSRHVSTAIFCDCSHNLLRGGLWCNSQAFCVIARETCRGAPEKEPTPRPRPSHEPKSQVSDGCNSHGPLTGRLAAGVQDLQRRMQAAAAPPPGLVPPAQWLGFLQRIPEALR